MLDRRRFLASAAGALAGPFAARAQRKRPNILFCIADDWGRHAGAYGTGHWIRTPAFDRIAGEGVLFENCFTSNPKCSPCRASILTGRNTWQLEEAINHFGIFPHKWPVFPDLLEEAGYHVGYTGKGWGPGDYEAGGFDRNPAGPAYQQRTLEPPYRYISNRDYAGNFEDFLEAREDGRPFYFWCGGHEPHRAYEDGAGVREGKDPEAVEVPAYYPDVDVIRRDLLDYAVEVEWFDAHVGRILKKLEQIGELDNTLVVMTSDHGMPFPRVKGQIFDDGFHIPLAMRWGAIEGDRTVEDFVNVRDFAPTFCEAAGLEPPETMTGSSLISILESGESGWIEPSRNRMLVGKERHDLGRPDDAGYPVRALRTPDFLYVRNYSPDAWPAGNPETGYRNVDDSPTKTFLTKTFDEHYRMSFGKRPAEMLFHVSEDPHCARNLAEKPDFWKKKSELRAEMERLLRADGDPRALGEAAIFETYKLYVGRDGHSYENWLEASGTNP